MCKPFEIFFKQNKKLVPTENPEVSLLDISILLGEKWEAMSLSEREKYIYAASEINGLIYERKAHLNDPSLFNCSKKASVERSSKTEQGCLNKNLSEINTEKSKDQFDWPKERKRITKEKRIRNPLLGERKTNSNGITNANKLKQKKTEIESADVSQSKDSHHQRKINENIKQKKSKECLHENQSKKWKDIFKIETDQINFWKNPTVSSFRERKKNVLTNRNNNKKGKNKKIEEEDKREFSLNCQISKDIKLEMINSKINDLKLSHLDRILNTKSNKLILTQYDENHNTDQYEDSDMEDWSNKLQKKVLEETWKLYFEESWTSQSQKIKLINTNLTCNKSKS